MKNAPKNDAALEKDSLLPFNFLQSIGSPPKIAPTKSIIVGSKKRSRQRLISPLRLSIDAPTPKKMGIKNLIFSLTFDLKLLKISIKRS